MTARIGSRIKALREQRAQSQDELARLFGFKDRQTLSAIETGERKVSAEELLRAVQLFGVQLDYFTDPFLLAGDGSFSWRQSGVRPAALADYEIDAGRLVAAFRALGPQVGRDAPLLRHALGLNRQSRLDEAAAAGERFARELRLGDVPAVRLAEVMERELGILVLMVDPIDGVSGASLAADQPGAPGEVRRKPHSGGPAPAQRSPETRAGTTSDALLQELRRSDSSRDRPGPGRGPPHLVPARPVDRRSGRSLQDLW